MCTVQEAKASASFGHAANNGSSSNVTSQSSQGLFIGDIEFEVVYSGTNQDKEVDAEFETTSRHLKVTPHWMITQKMDLTEEQHGQIKQELEMDKI
ncbi:hypothetical protein WN943_027490 [Citrus x changshan-huyou]